MGNVSLKVIVKSPWIFGAKKGTNPGARMPSQIKN